MSLDLFYVSWFDIVVLGLVALGLRRGFKKGISDELLIVLQWVSIVVVAGFGYQPLGVVIYQFGLFSVFFCYISAYILLAVLVKLLFTGIRKSAGEKLAESEAFGGAEYPLGMLGGGLRYFCIMLMVMSLLHAREYTAAERQAHAHYLQTNFGSNFFPSLADVQDEVFERSWAGRFSEDFLSQFLIKKTMCQSKPLRPSGMVRARERDVQRVLE